MIYVYINRPLPPEDPGGFAGIEGEGAPSLVLEYDQEMPRVGDRMFLGARFKNMSGVVVEVRHYLSDEAMDAEGRVEHEVMTSDKKRVFVPVEAIIGVAMQINIIS